MDDDPLTPVFAALASPIRRTMLDVIKERPGCSVHDVCDFFEISRIAVMKHLQVLERAGLVHSEKQGRTRALYFNAVPIQMIHERWTTEYSAYWAGALTQVKYRIEGALENAARRRSPAARPARTTQPPKSSQPAVRKRHA